MKMIMKNSVEKRDKRCKDNCKNNSLTNQNRYIKVVLWQNV